MSLVKTVILAAGKGKRMGTLVPKPLVPVAGRPMIAHLVETVTSIDTEKPIVVVSPASEELFKETLGDVVVYAVQHEALGTGDAVKASRAFWGNAEGIMVLYADHPFLPKHILLQLHEAFKKFPNAIHLLTATVPDYTGDYAHFASWGRILRGEDGRVTGIREVKDASAAERDIREVNPAMFLFPASWLASALNRLGHENASGEYYLTDVIGFACEEGVPLIATTTEALLVMGANTPEDLQVLERHHH